MTLTVALSHLPIFTGIGGGGSGRWMAPVIDAVARRQTVVSIAANPTRNGVYSATVRGPSESRDLAFDDSAVARLLVAADQIWCVDDTWLDIRSPHIRFLSNIEDAELVLSRPTLDVTRAYVPSTYLKERLALHSTFVLPMVLAGCSRWHESEAISRQIISFPHRLVDGKGHLEALRVLAELGRRGRRFTLEMREPASWNGRRGIELWSQINETADSLGVRSQVSWQSWLPYTETCRLYSDRPSISLTTSVLDESFCLAPVESLIHGAPAVALKHGAIGVEYGSIAGALWLVDPNGHDPDEVTSMLADAIETASMAAPDGRHSRYLLDYFSADSLEAAIAEGLLC